MARLPRLSVAGHPHYVVQRGNDRRSIFADAVDLGRYLDALREVAGQHQLAIHAYVLMPNHVHLLITPADSRAIGVAMQAIGRRYVRWFNDRHQRTGALFEGRYRSTVVEADRYLLACMRDIEQDPVRAAAVAAPDHYSWSSCRHHVGLAIDPVVTDHTGYWALGNTPFDRHANYRRLLEDGPLSAESELIRKAVHGGWVLGTQDFAVRLGRTSALAVPTRFGARSLHSVPAMQRGTD